MTDDAMTSGEVFLLRWLAAGEGHLGECAGPALDVLMNRGLADHSVDQLYHARITDEGVAYLRARGLVAYDGIN